MVVKRKFVRTLISAFASAGLLGLPWASHAASSTSDQSASDQMLAEVVVTAEKRDSTVQKTPISVTAISGEALAAQGVTNMVEVAQEVPRNVLSYRGAGSN